MVRSYIMTATDLWRKGLNFAARPQNGLSEVLTLWQSVPSQQWPAQVSLNQSVRTWRA